MTNRLKKIKIPRFFKTKSFLILAFLFALFFLFAPISLHQIGRKAEAFINNKAKEGVRRFERQTGLKAEWGDLRFNIFTMTVKLKAVQITPLPASPFQKIQELSFLEGKQNIQKISARPALYNLLFKKKIILSKLKIENGSIYLKTLKKYDKKEPPKMALPIKKIIIKNANINLRHRDYDFYFSQLQAKMSQKKESVFDFNLSVPAFRVKERLGFEDFKGVQPDILDKNNSSLNFNTAYQLSFKGRAQKGQVSFQEIHFKNENFKSLTRDLDIQFDSKTLKAARVKSSGSLPFFIIQKGMRIIGKDLFLFTALLNYKLDIQYKRGQGYQGDFEVQGAEAVFKSHKLKSFFLKGRLSRSFLSVEEGRVETKSQGQLKIEQAKWLFKGREMSFDFSAQVRRLSVDFVRQAVLDLEDFPIKGRFSGRVHCQGKIPFSSLKCAVQGQSDKISLQPNNQILSLNNMSLNLDINWNNNMLSFLATAEKNNFSDSRLEGKYFPSDNRLELSYSFFGHLSKDLQFKTPFPMEGEIQIQKGNLIIKDDNIHLTGSLSSPLLKIASYRLKNISSLYKLEGSHLKFFNIKGSPGRTRYVAECDVDFKKENLVLKMESSFFAIEDLLDFAKESVSWPFSLKGAGAIRFFMNFPWSQPEQKEFQVKADLFDVSANKDIFQQVTFDFGLTNKKGAVRSLFLKKGQGSILGSGVFDENFSLDLNIAGQNLSLERWEQLNKLLPFNQSGDVNFNMKITGAFEDPRARADISISNMFFYSYPVKDSRLQLNIDKKALLLSGHITDEIHIDRLVYPFSKKEEPSVSGRLADLDFIKILFSKNREQILQDYSSKAQGRFSLSQNTETKKWQGEAEIDKFYISKTNKWIKNEKPFSFSFNKSQWSLSPVQFSHDDNKKLIMEKESDNKWLVSGESSLGLFSVFFPFLKGFDGDIKGQIRLDNNLAQLNPRGFLKIDKGIFSIKPLPEFANVKADLVLSKNNIFISQLTSQAGGGLLKGEGSVLYDFIHPPEVNLNLNFFNSHIHLPKDFNTRGSGKLNIKGKKIPYLISGRYLIDSGSITKDFSAGTKKTKHDFSFLRKKEKKQDDIFELSLNIQTKQAVDINTSLIRSSIEGEADIYGQLSSLLINGQFSISKSAEENLIFFRGREFKINSGSILFKNTKPENPYLNIKADTLFKEQVVDPLEGHKEVEKTYKIFLSLKGPSKQPVFSLKSSPFLNEREIISLLTLGIGSRHFDANVKQDVIGYSYQILGSLLLEKLLNRKIKDTLGWDFRPASYINTLNKPVTKITLSKKWFKKWKTSFSRTIEEQAQSDIRLKYDLNKKISLTAFWEDTRQLELEDNQDLLGLDFEFNVDF